MATWLEMSRSPEYSPAILSRELRKVHYLVGIDEFDEALAGETIILGGYLNTKLIKAKSIFAEHLDVDSLSAISADLGSVTSGLITGATIRTSDTGDRIQLDQSRLRAYLDNVMRVQFDYDSLDFYNSQNIHVGSLLGSYFDGNHKMITHSSRVAEMVASTDFVAGSNEDPDNGARVVVYSDYDGFAPSASIEAGTNRSTNFASIIFDEF